MTRLRRYLTQRARREMEFPVAGPAGYPFSRRG